MQRERERERLSKLERAAGRQQETNGEKDTHTATGNKGIPGQKPKRI